MTNGITKYSIYSMLFKNPMSPADRNPQLNMLYGAGVTALYSTKLNALAKKDLSTYLQSFNNMMSDLKNSSAKLMTSSKDSVFNDRSAQSSDTNILTAQAAPKAQKKEYTLKVDSLALSQINQSYQFDSNATGGFSSGFQSFKVEKGTKSATIYLDIKSTQTNRDVLKEASAKINASGLGITSTVEEKDGKSFLKMTSETGTANTFTLQDTSGDFVFKAGLYSASQNAQDANYSIEGKGYTSSTNTVKLDEGKVTVSLKGIGEAKVMVGDDTKAVVATVKGFAEDFNETMSFLNTHRGNVNVTRLMKDLTNTLKYNKYDMEEIGIKADSEGTLSVDETKLQNALKTDMNKVKSVLGSYTGLASKVNHEAVEALERPAFSYTDYQINNKNMSAYSNLYNYMHTAQRQYLAKTLQQGALFDMVL